MSAIPSRHKLSLVVLGAGPETRGWKRLAKRLGLLEQIEWKGQLPHADALAVTAQGHIFVLTSLKEATSTVVVEALQFGLPVICHDACGMATAVTTDCGIKVPLLNPRTSIDGFQLAIEQLLGDPGLLSRLSDGASRRAAELSWDRRAICMAEAYTAAL